MSAIDSASRGYCYEVQCMYSAGEGQAKVDETLTFVENMLYKIGSKLVPGIGKIAWVEAPSLPV